MNFSPTTKLKVTLLALLSFFIFMPALSFAGSTLVIDEFQIAGKTAYDEYLVIANYGLKPEPLTGYKILKYTAAGADSEMFTGFGDYILDVGQRLMICHTSYLGDKLPSHLTYTGTIAMAPNNSIALVSSVGEVDLVGYGQYGDNSVKYSEGDAISPSPSAYQVLTRENGYDSDDNNKDFRVRTTPVIIDPNANKVVISELLPSPASGEEWLELYNSTNLTISLANLKICDVLGSTHCYFFDKNDYLLANSYKIYPQSLTKITLNNTGDWLEFYDTDDNLLTDSGGDYGAADKGVSLSIFGSEYRWTKSVTPTAENIFTDIIELEDEPIAKPKTTKSKVVKSTKKTVVSVATDENEEPAVESAVKAADTASPDMEVKSETKKAVINNKVLGWGLIGLAILLVLGYTGWYLRDYAKNIYDKIRHRDDSARF